jgi:ACT domain-containing protein
LHRKLEPLSKEEERALMIKRIEEAKSKVVPIEFSEEDRKKYLKTLEELKADKEVIFIDPKTREVLD